MVENQLQQHQQHRIPESVLEFLLQQLLLAMVMASQMVVTELEYHLLPTMEQEEQEEHKLTE